VRQDDAFIEVGELEQRPDPRAGQPVAAILVGMLMDVEGRLFILRQHAVGDPGL
jgi:hypothetical protein